MLNIIPRRFIYSAVGSSVGLIVTGLYRKILLGLLGSSFTEEYELPAGILKRVKNNFPASFARTIQHGEENPSLGRGMVVCMSIKTRFIVSRRFQIFFFFVHQPNISRNLMFWVRKLL